jgi:methyl-accepting chemotaxis protein
MNRRDEPGSPHATRNVAIASVFGFIAVALSLPTGCVAPRPPQPRAATSAPSEQISREELRNALDQYDDFFESTIKQAAADIDARMPDPRTRRLTLMWKVRMVPANDAALKHADPVKAFVECWTLAMRMAQFLETGDGRSFFGANQTIAVAAAKRIESDIERVGRSFLPPDTFAKATDDVRAFAQAHPMQDTFAEAVVRAPATKEGVPSPLASILNVPLAPFRVAEGIDQGASAIRGLGDMANRFTDIVQELPEAVRWQLQLLLLDLDQNDLLLSFLASFAQFSCSTAQLADTAQRLPEELRQQASKLLAEIDARQAGIQATLERAERTAATVERALARVDVVAASVDLTGQSVANAGRAWEGTARQIEQTIQDIRHDKYPTEPTSQGTATSAASPSPSPASPAVPAPAIAPMPASAPATTTAPERPFEILDYRDTANALTITAQQLQALTAEVRATIDSRGLTDRIRDVDGRVLGVVDYTSTRARSLTDHIAWRVAQLIALVFVLAIAYRIISHRWTGKTR